jgi:hypothetical protein
MKKAILNILLILASITMTAQVGIGTTAPKASLDIVGTNNDGVYVTADGVLIPRVSTVPNNTTAPGVDEGELIYVNGTGFYFWDADSWEPLDIRISPKFSDGDIAADAVFTGGNVGIGLTNPSALLDVAGAIKIGNTSSSPTTGMILSSTDPNGGGVPGSHFWGYDGSTWVQLDN